LPDGLTAQPIEGRRHLQDVRSGPEQYVEYTNGDQAYPVGATYLARSVDGDARPDGRVISIV
jgi:hypothetical protein